ncbi:MAG: cell division protein FtsQ, partial [Mycobacterium sp.]
MTQPNDATPTDVVGEPADTEVTDDAADSAITEPIFAGGPDVQTPTEDDEFEGPRRRARRERAERRAAQARATAIE